MSQSPSETVNGSEPASSQDVFAADCPVRPIFGDITSRWATLVLAALVTRPHRFSELAALGTDLMPRLMGLVTWVDHHTSTIQGAQAAYDADTPVPPPVANRH